MLAPNTILQNRYRVIRQLGQGGMGAVYEAIDQRVSSLVALKETLVGSAPEARRAFEREAALLANLRHAALPKVMDYFSENDGEFLVMEYVSGTDLGALLESHDGPFPEAQIVRWGYRILALLEYLHSREPPILHRDIKPSNLKVTEQGEIFLLDFGLAKGAAGQMTTLGVSRSVRGYTPAYSPIEQIAGRGTDPRSDLYALGATMYHLLTGQSPVDAPTRYAAIDDGEPDPLALVHQINAKVSAQLSDVIHRAMAVSRRDRPASAKEMREKLAVIVSVIQRASEQETLRIAPVPAEQSAATEPPPTVPSPATPEPKPEEIPSLAIPSPAPTRPAGPATLPSNQFLRDSLSNRVGETDPTPIASAAESSKAGTIAAIVVVSLLLIGAMAILVWLLSRGGQTGTTSSQQPGPVASPSISTSRHETFVVSLNGLPLEMVLVPAGEFVMGSDNDTEWSKPPHRVVISQPFYMGKYEVTQSQWRAVVGADFLSSRALGPLSERGVGDAYPIYNVNWDDVQEFLKRLNRMDADHTYRLPTEAEWEYACRAGTTGDDNSDLPLRAWYLANSDSLTHPVGTKQPNAFGLYDMLGNVYEWCEDFFDSDYYRISPNNDPKGPAKGAYRVIRGGGFTTGATGTQSVRASSRISFPPAERSVDVGFRLVAVAQAK